MGEFHGEGASETAADLRLLQLLLLKSGDGAQQLLRFLPYSQLPEQVATGVVGGRALVAGPAQGGVLHSQDLHQEFGELVGLGGQGPGLGQQFGVFGEQVQIKNAQGGGAGAGRDHNVLAFLELFQDPLGQDAGLPVEPGVVDGLAAAGLVLGKAHGDAQPPEDVDHADTDLRIELVDDAGDEQVGGDVGFLGQEGSLPYPASGSVPEAWPASNFGALLTPAWGVITLAPIFPQRP